MGKETKAYKEDIFRIFNEIEQGLPKVTEVAGMMAEAIEKDQLIHIIGTGGHSNLVAEEALWRAGGLAPMDPMLDCGTNLMMGARHSSIVERTPGYGCRVLDMYDCKPGEIIIICNAYGINSMTIDIALESKRRGLKTVAITSTAFCKTVPKGHPARHPSGKNLYEIVDTWIDCCVPYGDANAVIDGLEEKVAGTSILCNSFAWNLLLIETCRILMEKGIVPPTWRSANAIGGDEANKALEKKYFHRVKHLL